MPPTTTATPCCTSRARTGTAAWPRCLAPSGALHLQLKLRYQVLLRGGANMNVQNNKGQTPLHFAFAFGYQELGQCVARSRNVIDKA